MAQTSPMLKIDPPLLNTSSKWASEESELEELYNCSDTGAITIRTSLLNGFDDNPEIHRFCFYDTSKSQISPSPGPADKITSLNTIGYSPITLSSYITIIERIMKTSSRSDPKPVIFSVTGTAEEVAGCLELLSTSPCREYCMMEINLSCPNIPGKPPPAYSSSELVSYLAALGTSPSIPVGLKLPPYTYHDQFVAVISAINSPNVYPVSFLTSTNTLGSSLILGPDSETPALSSAAYSSSGIGGLAGEALHPLALGNVKILRTLLDKAELQHIKIIGVGGVSDNDGFRRMQNVGAYAVGVATALGAQGVSIFGKIRSGIS